MISLLPKRKYRSRNAFLRREGRENPSPAQASLRTVLEEGKK